MHTKIVPILYPIVAFSYRYEMKIVSVILQNQKHVVSVIYGGVKNGMSYSENAKNYKRD